MNIVSLKEVEGRGQFEPLVKANPTIGQIDKIEYVDEVKLIYDR